MDPAQKYGFFCDLDAAAKETTAALTRANIRHGFMGGYATSLIGGSRMTQDVDVIVDSDPNEARSVLLQANARFTITPSNKLVFPGRNDTSIAVELLRGGEGKQLKLPDAKMISLRPITPNGLPGRVEETPSEYLCVLLEPAFVNRPTNALKFPSLHPPSSSSPNSRDRHSSPTPPVPLIDFEGYPEKPKHELLALVRKLYQMHTAIRPLLAVTLSADDLALISN
ncbi:hypothetical protein N7461_005022 [Penicillium sp. DV-2018c]|nr:hypothetical protein N7461_005022 [Penicillium sp. DV-2018c]